MRAMILCLLGVVGLTQIARGESAGEAPRVVIETNHGNIVLELYPDKAPATVANFLRYVDGGFYADGSFHRTVHQDNQPNDSVRIAVIQGDVNRGSASAAVGK